jgi:plastocyanin
VSASACTGGGTPGPSPISAPPLHPEAFTLLMDATSPADPTLAFPRFFPAEVKVRPGDSVQFTPGYATEVMPHTFTFGLAPDGSDQPRAYLADGRENAFLDDPCFAPGGPSRDMTSCPQPPELNDAANMPPYGGTGFWNSGLVAQPGTRVSVHLAGDIPVGRYLFKCLLHRGMVGALEVVGRDVERLAPREVSAEGRRELREAVASADSGLPVPKPTGTGGGRVIAGWGETGSVLVQRFSPDPVTVAAGAEVTWESPSYLHTVTFESPGLEDRALPSGARSGSDYDGGDANSGYIGPAWTSSSFALRFVRSGSYHYVCVLHPGMEGTVRVVTGG